MHVEDGNGSAQQMIVDGTHLQSFIEQLLHHRAYLGVEEDEIAQQHRATGWHRLECSPPAEGEGRLDGYAVDGDVQIGARESVTMDFARRCCALSAEDLVDLGPIGLGSNGRVTKEEECQARRNGNEALHGISPLVTTKCW